MSLHFTPDSLFPYKDKLLIIIVTSSLAVSNLTESAIHIQLLTTLLAIHKYHITFTTSKKHHFTICHVTQTKSLIKARILLSTIGTQTCGNLTGKLYITVGKILINKDFDEDALDSF